MSETNHPSAELKALDRLVGTWAVTGGAEGTVRYEWMPGRFLLEGRSFLPPAPVSRGGWTSALDGLCDL
ncbi:hypothetical protein [Streptomyces sp. NBC_00057]|uniref:hypothetical protein n=1 Tax=Streptomyces sp. NBC_00057 TaxID=2975634 RepID=UPI00324D5C55